MNLYQLFSASAARFPNHPAIIQDNQKYTYFQLSAEVDKLASSFHRLGLRNGDRVMVLLKNRIETVAIFLAVQKLGAVFAPVNLRLSIEDILTCVNDIEAKFILFENASWHLIKNQKFAERPLLIGIDDKLGDMCYRELMTQETFEVAPYPAKDDDLAVILYTSGTSGKPKGVPRSHKNEHASTMAHIIQCHYRPYERTLGIPSMSHSIGLRSLLAMICLNGVYLPFPDFDAYKALKIISAEKISCLFLTPTLYHDIVTHPNASKTDCTTVHVIAYSGGHMKYQLIEKCSELFQPELFVNQYGSTEIYTFSTFQDVRKKPGCVGRAGFHEQIRLIKKGSNLGYSFFHNVEQGEIGEIIVDMNSPEAFRGYWNRPDATIKAIKDGWYFTGDLGYLDHDGDLHLVGRADDMIISNGQKIYPIEIEKVLMEHPFVHEAVVIGEEDERWGQIVTAFIVSDDKELTPQSLDYFCKIHNRLSNDKRPRKYIFIQEVPKNAAGKILRRELKLGHYTQATC